MNHFGSCGLIIEGPKPPILLGLVRPILFTCRLEEPIQLNLVVPRYGDKSSRHYHHTTSQYIPERTPQNPNQQIINEWITSHLRMILQLTLRGCPRAPGPKTKIQRGKSWVSLKITEKYKVNCQKGFLQHVGRSSSFLSGGPVGREGPEPSFWHRKRKISILQVLCVAFPHFCLWRKSVYKPWWSGQSYPKKEVCQPSRGCKEVGIFLLKWYGIMSDIPDPPNRTQLTLTE